MIRKLRKASSIFCLSIVMLIFSSQLCLADTNPVTIQGVNLGDLQGALNGLITQQQVNQSTNPKLSDRANVSESIDPVSGALTLKQTDITLPGKDGFDLSIGRIYNSAKAEVGTKRVKVESSSSSWTSTEDGWMLYMLRYYASTGYWSSVEVGPISSEAEADWLFDFYCNLVLDDGFYVVQDPVYTRVITYYTNYTVTTTTAPQKYNYDRSRYDLGTGWSLALPSLQIENEQGTEYHYFHDGTGAVYRVVYTADTGDSNLEDYQGKDVEFSRDTGSYSNGQMSSAYKFTSSDKKVTYFGSDGRLLGIKDRFGNEIKFTHVDRTIYTNSSLVRGTTYPFIDKIIDSVGRTITFQYENSINTPDGFDGDTITITVNDPSNTKNLKITYVKDRTQITATDNYGNILDSFYEPELLYVQDPRGLWTEYVDYDRITGVQSQLKFLYDSKDLSQPAANIAYLLGAAKYTNTVSFYTYEKTTRNLGPDGATEAFRVKSRYDKEWKYDSITTTWNLLGDINHVNYSYGGDYTGYPSYNSEELMPESYQFWSQADFSNGIKQKSVFNGKKQQSYTETIAGNNEKQKITNELFDSNFTYKPTKIRIDEYASDGTIANTLYTEQAYYDWGGLRSRTQPLNSAQLNDSILKAKYTETYEYESTYKFITKKQWYQDENKQLSESYTYDSLGQMKTYTNAKGETTNYYYYNDLGDSRVKIIESTITTENPNPAKTVKVFGAASNYAYPTVVEEYYTDENGNYTKSATTKTYNMLLGLVASETNNKGRTTNYEYDNLGRILSIKTPDFTNLDGKNYSVQQIFGYFENGTMEDVINYFDTNMPYYSDSVKDFIDPENQGLGSTIIYSVAYYLDKGSNTAYIYQPSISAYDGYGNLVQQETYDNTNNAFQWIVKSRNVFDSLKRSVSYTDAQNNTVKYAYDSWGNLGETLDPFNNLYKTEYDLRTRKVSNFFIPEADVTNYRANPANNSLKENVVESYLDQWGRVIERRAFPNWPDTSGYLSEKYGYDIAGNEISFIDAKRNLNEDGYTRQYEYDELNRVSKVKDALNQLTEVSYSVLGGIKSIKLRENAGSEPIEIYTKSYNELGKLSTKTDPMSQQEAYKYNDLGLIEKFTDRNNSSFTYSYNELNNLQTDKAVSSDNTSSSEFRYLWNDPLGVDRVAEYANDTLTGTASYGYNMAARVTQQNIQYPGNNYSSYLTNSYDLADRLSSTSIGNNAGSYFYTNYAYDKTRLSKVQSNGSQAPDPTDQAYVTYEYYPDGKAKKVTYPRLDDGAYLTTSYDYDKLSRLKTVTNAKGTTVISQYSYTYDANGNIETINDGNTTTIYSYDKLDRLAEIHRPNGDTIKYTYDLRGNRKTIEGSALLIDPEDTNYSYDVREKLVNVTKDTNSTKIDYRSDGLRYAKTSGVNAVQYHYNLAGKVIAESDVAGNIISNYVWGPDRALVKKDSTGGEYYYLYNGHGDVVQLIDRNGNVVSKQSRRESPYFVRSR